jgi:glycosyltransferase involved in cell wall biosynthesis
VRALFYHADRAWSGRARVFAAAARGLAARGYQVTFVCQPESAVEQRLSANGYDIVPVYGRAGIRGGLRLRRITHERFVEVVFVHTEREHLAAALALRLAERGAVIRRIGAGETLTVGWRARYARRLAAAGALQTLMLDEPPPVPPLGSLETVWGDLGIDVAMHDATVPVGRASLKAGGTTRLIVGICDARTTRAQVANVLRTVALLAPRHPELRLALIGARSDDEDIRIHAAALGITKIVTQLGERDDELAVFRAADVGWVIANGDTAAFAALDLMALRVPVLAERTPLMHRYVADAITGILLPPTDPPATAATVASFLARDAQRIAMGNAGRARVSREFPESAMVDAFDRAAAIARDRERWHR